jgi:hypothetical protein
MAAISAKGTYSFENETLYLQISDSDEATIQTDYFASIHSLGLRCANEVSKRFINVPLIQSSVYHKSERCH